MRFLLEKSKVLELLKESAGHTSVKLKFTEIKARSGGLEFQKKLQPRVFVLVSEYRADLI